MQAREGSGERLQGVLFLRIVEVEAATGEHGDLAGDWGQRAEVLTRSVRALR